MYAEVLGLILWGWYLHIVVDVVDLSTGLEVECLRPVNVWLGHQGSLQPICEHGYENGNVCPQFPLQTQLHVAPEVTKCVEVLVCPW